MQAPVQIFCILVKANVFPSPKFQESEVALVEADVKIIVWQKTLIFQHKTECRFKFVIYMRPMRNVFLFFATDVKQNEIIISKKSAIFL
jgi:hypothetical protein